MANGFSTDKKQPETNTQQEPQRVNYQGKTPDGYAAFTAHKSVEERFKLADAIAREGAEEIIEDVAYLQSRYVQKGLADGTVTAKTLGHLTQGNVAQNQAREQAYFAIDQMFISGEIETANFTNILSSSSAPLQLKGAR